MNPLTLKCLSACLAIIFLLSALSNANLTGEAIDQDDCVCNTEDAPLYTKAGYEHPIKRYMLRNTCANATGESITIFGQAWYRFTLDDNLYWTSGDYLSHLPAGSALCQVH